MNADGSDLRAITTVGTVSNMPRWSPDGRRLAIHLRAVGAANAPPALDIAVVDLVDGAPPIVVVKDATLLGYFRRAG
jgi:Tol biopolymer transport system component